MPFVSVIVPVYNDLPSLGVLLEALKGQDYPRERFECLVVDNASVPPVRIVRAGTFPARVLRELQPGSYAARNRGLQEARGDVLAFTDADCTPRYDWLTSAVKVLQAADKPTMIAGRVEVASQGGRAASVCEWHSVVNDLNQARFLNQYHFAATANMITTRQVFQAVGPFNGQLSSGGDFEWGQRARSAGIQQRYADQVVVRHPARADWRSLVAKTRRIAGGHYLLHRGTACPMLVAASLTLRIAGASLSRSWVDPRLPSLFCRLRVMSLDLALRLIQFAEVVRLGCGGQPRRC